ncbi:hypothetical protein F4809DRAFT_167109 [Biscogniauxia mediterranea]|nr:hypothetical protein F4809DRAFT_167109 [Biscogniauxia mediterranea]
MCSISLFLILRILLGGVKNYPRKKRQKKSKKGRDKGSWPFLFFFYVLRKGTHRWISHHLGLHTHEGKMLGYGIRRSYFLNRKRLD